MKKKLLSEAQVRRFMGLAGLKSINEMAYKHDDLMEEEDPMMGDEAAEAPAEEGGEADVEMDEEDLADVKEALETLQDKLAPLLDQAEGGEDMELGDEEPAEEPVEEPAEEPVEEPAEEPEMDMDDEDMDKELQEVNMELTEDEIVNEVARRVAKRIVEAKRAHKRMNEALGRKR